jgi:hypothetical protein
VNEVKEKGCIGHRKRRAGIFSSVCRKRTQIKSRTAVRKTLFASLFLFSLFWSFAFQSIGNLGSYALASGSPLKAIVDLSEVIGKNNLSLGTQIHGYDNFPGKPTLQQKAAQIGFEIVRVFVTRDKSTEPCLSWNETSSTGVFDWSHIDPLVKSIYGIGAEPLLTVGAGEFPDVVVPHGMTGNYMGTRFPNPKSFGSYVVAIMRHLISIGCNVEYWGIWRTPTIRDSSGSINAGIVLNYTRFFNVVQDYIHGVDPNALVSSDRTMYRAFFDVFVKYARGVGYLSFMKYDAFGTPYDRPEGYISGDKLMQRAGVINQPTGGSWAIYSPKELQQRWLASQGQSLPVIAVEVNMNSAYGSGTDPRIQTPLGSAWYAEALKSFILDGSVICSTYYLYCSDASSLWGPGRTTGWGLGMIRSTYPYTQWYPYWTNYLFGKNLRVGNSLFYTYAKNSTLVSLLAWGNSTHYFVLVIGKTNNTYNVDLQLNNGEVNTQKTLHVYRIDMQYNGLYSRDVNYSAPIRLTLAGYSVNLVVISRSQLKPSLVLFEDGFESTDFSNWTGTYASTGETESVVNNLRHHGDNSAAFISDGKEEIEYSYCYKTVASSSELNVRSYFYVATSGIIDNKDHFYLISLKTKNSTVAYAGWWKIGGLTKWCLVIRNGTDNIFAYSKSTPSCNRWYSVELHWKKNATSGFGELWIDGTRVCSITSRNTAAFGDVNQIRVGLPGIYYSDRTIVYADCVKAAAEFVG